MAKEDRWWNLIEMMRINWENAMMGELKGQNSYIEI
jgi:hypothetical protein